MQAENESISSLKNDLESKLSTEKQSNEARVLLLEKEKLELTTSLEMLQKTFENTEKILEERTHNRDEYAAKISVLDEQLREISASLLQAENGLNAKNMELNETKLMLEAAHSQLEQNERSLLETRQSAEQMVKLEQENLEKLKTENQSLMEQIGLLQQELSRMGQDICILKTQEPFKNSPRRETPVFGGAALSDSTESSSNLLEIDRYLRTQKEQLEEKYEDLHLNHEISQQRLKTIENELEFTRKQSELYENEINHLKVSIFFYLSFY